METDLPSKNLYATGGAMVGRERGDLSVSGLIKAHGCPRNAAFTLPLTPAHPLLFANRCDRDGIRVHNVAALVRPV